MFKIFSKRRQLTDAALDLYTAVVEQARNPFFYTNAGVPDTPDGRYDMIMIHAFLLLQRLKIDHPKSEALGQAFFDLMFDDMDQNLREMGAGDVGIGRRIKDMSSAFYGRIAAYEAGLRTDDGTLAEALERNVYRNNAPSPDNILALTAYVRAQSAFLEPQEYDRLDGGHIVFQAPEMLANRYSDERREGE